MNSHGCQIKTPLHRSVRRRRQNFRVAYIAAMDPEHAKDMVAKVLVAAALDEDEEVASVMNEELKYSPTLTICSSNTGSGPMAIQCQWRKPSQCRADHRQCKTRPANPRPFCMARSMQRQPAVLQRFRADHDPLCRPIQAGSRRFRCGL